MKKGEQKYTNKRVYILNADVYKHLKRRDKIDNKLSTSIAYFDKDKAIEEAENMMLECNKNNLHVKKESNLDFIYKCSNFNECGESEERLAINICIKEYELIVANSGEEQDEVGDYVYVYTVRKNINCVKVEDLVFINEDRAKRFNEQTLEILKLMTEREANMFGYNLKNVFIEEGPRNDYYYEAYPGLIFVNQTFINNNTCQEYFTHIKKVKLIK